MRTPYIVTIFVDKADVDAANKALAELGFGEGNFNIDATDKFVFSAPLQQWEYNRIVAALDAAGIIYKLYEDANDGNVKEKIESAAGEEGLEIVKN